MAHLEEKIIITGDVSDAVKKLNSLQAAFKNIEKEAAGQRAFADSLNRYNAKIGTTTVSMNKMTVAASNMSGVIETRLTRGLNVAAINMAGIDGPAGILLRTLSLIGPEGALASAALITFAGAIYKGATAMSELNRQIEEHERLLREYASNQRWMNNLSEEDNTLLRSKQKEYKELMKVFDEVKKRKDEIEDADILALRLRAEERYAKLQEQAKTAKTPEERAGIETQMGIMRETYGIKTPEQQEKELLESVQLTKSERIDKAIKEMQAELFPKEATKGIKVNFKSNYDEVLKAGYEAIEAQNKFYLESGIITEQEYWGNKLKMVSEGSAEYYKILSELYKTNSDEKKKTDDAEIQAERDKKNALLAIEQEWNNLRQVSYQNAITGLMLMGNAWESSFLTNLASIGQDAVQIAGLLAQLGAMQEIGKFGIAGIFTAIGVAGYGASIISKMNAMLSGTKKGGAVGGVVTATAVPSYTGGGYNAGGGGGQSTTYNINGIISTDVWRIILRGELGDAFKKEALRSA